MRQWAAEVAEVRRAVQGREQRWAGRVEALREKVLAVEGRLREEQERGCRAADTIEGAASGRAKARRRF